MLSSACKASTALVQDCIATAFLQAMEKRLGLRAQSVHARLVGIVADRSASSRGDAEEIEGEEELDEDDEKGVDGVGRERLTM